MKQYLFLGDSITDADHLFDPANLGYGYVSLLARRPEYAECPDKYEVTLLELHAAIESTNRNEFWY